MPRSRSNIITLLAAVLLTVPACPGLAAAGGKARIDPSLWNSAVNNLLAVGMYGIELPENGDMAIKLQQMKNMYKGIAPDKARLNGHSITFSYEGSSGLLGFSAGYIYTTDQADRGPETILFGFDPAGQESINLSDSWYLALDLSGSYQVHNDVAIGMGTKTMLMKNPFSSTEGRIFSFLFNMPLSYKKFVTITPELQWSHPLPDSRLSAPAEAGLKNRDASQDIFYGGVSVSFSY